MSVRRAYRDDSRRVSRREDATKNLVAGCVFAPVAGGHNHHDAGIDSFADSNAKRIRLVTLRDASSQGKIHHANVVGRLVLDGPVDAGNHV